MIEALIVVFCVCAMLAAPAYVFYAYVRAPGRH